MLRKTLRTADLHTICTNQQRNAYADVVLTCGSIIEDALREAWRHFYDEGPPDDVRSVDEKVEQELKKSGANVLDPMGLQRAYHVLKRAGFFDAWAGWRSVRNADLFTEDLEALLAIRNDFQHRRSQTTSVQLADGAVTRKQSRDMAKACIRALDGLGQLQRGQARSWTERLGERPVDPPINNLPSQWYMRLKTPA